MKVISIVGARPNFMKVAPIHKYLSSFGFIDSIIVHTGQHYDKKMSDIFFNQLELPKPKYYLGVQGGSHTFQKAHVMLKLEKVYEEEKPDVVLVVGDVNATAAASIVSVKQGIPTVHVEAGLRSGDRSMPEEINRIITDGIVDHLFVSEHSGLVNLAKEGVPSDKVSYVGNVMIDSLINYENKADQLSIEEQWNIKKQNYVLMTMHRPSNVDTQESLEKVLSIMEYITKKLPMVFPIHPRTKSNLEKYGLLQRLEAIDNIRLLGPQGYIEFIALMKNSKFIITDSGGIQEETTYLNVPCVTFRSTTERPVTVEFGSNYLIDSLDVDQVKQRINTILNNEIKNSFCPPLWDGKAAERIGNVLIELYK